MDFYIDTKNNTIMWEDQELSLKSILLREAERFYDKILKKGYSCADLFKDNGVGKTLDIVATISVTSAFSKLFGYNIDVETREEVVKFFKNLVSEISGTTVKPENYFN